MCFINYSALQFAVSSVIIHSSILNLTVTNCALNHEHVHISRHIKYPQYTTPRLSYCTQYEGCGVVPCAYILLINYIQTSQERLHTKNVTCSLRFNVHHMSLCYVMFFYPQLHMFLCVLLAVP
ncbi:hypothetical protein PO909_016547, partial [Leuciscus waleckii]